MKWWLLFFLPYLLPVLTKVHLNVEVGNGVSCKNLKTSMGQTSLFSKVTCLGVEWLSLLLYPEWHWGSSCWVPGCVASGISGWSMKVNTGLLLLKHRMDGALASCLVYAFKAYHVGTGATFVRIYNFDLMHLVESPTCFSLLCTQQWRGTESCACFWRLEGLHVLGTENRKYYIGINSVLMSL